MGDRGAPPEATSARQEKGVSVCDLMKGKLNVQSELDSYLDIAGAEWILTGINWL